MVQALASRENSGRNILQRSYILRHPAEAHWSKNLSSCLVNVTSLSKGTTGDGKWNILICLQLSLRPRAKGLELDIVGNAENSRRNACAAATCSCTVARLLQLNLPWLGAGYFVSTYHHVQQHTIHAYQRLLLRPSPLMLVSTHLPASLPLLIVSMTLWYRKLPYTAIFCYQEERSASHITQGSPAYSMCTGFSPPTFDSHVRPA